MASDEIDPHLNKYRWAKQLLATLLFVDFTKAFDTIHRGKIEQILLAYGLPKETVAAITILYRNTNMNVLYRMENSLLLSYIPIQHRSFYFVYIL